MKTIQIAFTYPLSSRRRKMSAKHVIASQIHRKNAKKISIDHSTSRNG
jgi:hypothetical protein